MVLQQFSDTIGNAIVFAICREPSSEELTAVTILQTEIRKYLTNKIAKCVQAGECYYMLFYIMLTLLQVLHIM